MGISFLWRSPGYFSDNNRWWAPALGSVWVFCAGLEVEEDRGAHPPQCSVCETTSLKPVQPPPWWVCVWWAAQINLRVLLGELSKSTSAEMPCGTDTEMLLSTSCRHEPLWGCEKARSGKSKHSLSPPTVVRNNRLVLKLSNIWCLWKILLFTLCCSSLFCSIHPTQFISPFSTGSSNTINFNRLLLLPVFGNFPFLTPPLNKQCQCGCADCSREDL